MVYGERRFGGGDRGERRSFGGRSGGSSYGNSSYGGGSSGGFERRSFAPVKDGEELDVKIEAVAEKGDGIAKKNGFVIFVPGTKVGDDVKIKITKVARRVAFAEVVGKGSPKAAEKTEGSEASEETTETEEATEEPAAEESEDFGEEETTETEEKEEKTDDGQEVADDF